MKKINNDVYLEVIKKCTMYEIYLNGKYIGKFSFELQNDSVLEITFKFINSLLNKNLYINEMKEYLIENYLVKDVEEMTNEEFAEYLVENVDELYVGSTDGTDGNKDHIYYKGEPVYRISNDEINFSCWNNGLLTDKVTFCIFNSSDHTPSKGNRKKFVSIVKQTIDYLEKFEIKEDGE